MAPFLMLAVCWRQDASVAMWNRLKKEAMAAEAAAKPSSEKSGSVGGESANSKAVDE